MRRTPVLASLCAGLMTGCHLTGGPACDTCSPPKVPTCGYKSVYDDFVTKATAKSCAERDLKAQCGCGAVPKDFADGYEQAYVDLAFGREPIVPAVPPKKYWNAYYRSCAGSEAVEQWFAGYAAGLEAGRAGGVSRFQRVATSWRGHGGGFGPQGCGPDGCGRDGGPAGDAWGGMPAVPFSATAPGPSAPVPYSGPSAFPIGGGAPGRFAPNASCPTGRCQGGAGASWGLIGQADQPGSSVDPSPRNDAPVLGADPSGNGHRPMLSPALAFAPPLSTNATALSPSVMNPTGMIPPVMGPVAVGQPLGGQPLAGQTGTGPTEAVIIPVGTLVPGVQPGSTGPGSHLGGPPFAPDPPVGDRPPLADQSRLIVPPHMMGVPQFVVPMPSWSQWGGPGGPPVMMGPGMAGPVPTEPWPVGSLPGVGPGQTAPPGRPPIGSQISPAVFSDR